MPAPKRFRKAAEREKGIGIMTAITGKTVLVTGANRGIGQALRSLLGGRIMRVQAVLSGPVDTDMTRGFEIQKAPAQAVAQAIFSGVERDEEDIFPDPVAEMVGDAWRSETAKALEGQFAALATGVPARPAA